MSQLIPPRTNTIMQTAPHLQTSQKTCSTLAEDSAESRTPSTYLSNTSTMRFSSNTAGSKPPLSSNNTSPISTRSSSLSSLNHPNISSASSDASAGIPVRSPMKSNLRHSRSVGVSLNRRSAPSTVRFLDPEPLPRTSTEPGKTMSLKASISEMRPGRPGLPRVATTPNLGPHQHHQKKIMIATLTRPQLLSPASKRTSTIGSSGESAGSLQTSAPTRSATQLRQRLDKRFSAPVVPSRVEPRADPRWSGIPLPAGFVPPSRAPLLTKRTTSYHSVASNLSSSPVVASLPAAPSKSDPLQNYIPCMAAMCTAHYTVAHSGPTYYVAQEPYGLSRHHGYCPRHASKEMKEANALCKKEYETMRQSAGRKTLGVIAQDFEIFLQLYREARDVEDARLQQAQSRRVVVSPQASVKGKKLLTDDAFDWRYTPRNCTKRGCASLPYSPFSTQHYSFYNTPNASTQLMPLATLCPGCSKAEIDGFGTKLMEKWSSRCGWDGEEWDGWYHNSIQLRKSEMEFWAKAQERVVRDKLVKSGKSVEREVGEKGEEKQEGGVEQTDGGMTPIKEKRKSIFKRIFRMSETTGAVVVAAAIAA